MIAEADRGANDGRRPIPRSSLAALGLILAVFCLLRVPILYRHYGGQDEDWYAIPGFTVAQTGIPRVPYAPCRSLKSCFYKVDEALLALPPAYFYWQAPFYWLLPAGYGTARLASAVAGMIAIGYTGGGHTYAEHGARLTAAGAAAICPDWHEVSRHLAGLGVPA